MKQKASIFLILGVITAGASCRTTEPQVGEVCGRYDYSSPRASLESIQKAVRDHDMSGIFIHPWQIYKRDRKTTWYGKTFHDIMAELWPYGENPPPEAEALLNELSTSWVSGGLKFTDAVFLREESRRHIKASGKLDTDATVCSMVIHWPSQKKGGRVQAVNYQGSEDWWFALFLGEDPFRIRTFDLKPEEQEPNNPTEATSQ